MTVTTDTEARLCDRVYQAIVDTDRYVQGNCSLASVLLAYMLHCKGISATVHCGSTTSFAAIDTILCAHCWVTTQTMRHDPTVAQFSGRLHEERSNPLADHERLYSPHGWHGPVCQTPTSIAMLKLQLERTSWPIWLPARQEALIRKLAVEEPSLLEILGA